jgi:hypothetical protein
MKIATVIDRTLRTFAALAAIVAVPLVFLVGIMANDAGTSTGAIGSLIILGVGGSLTCWILFCSFRPAAAAGWLWPSEVLRVLLVQLPTYAAGAAAIFGCLYFLHDHYHNKSLAQSRAALRPTDASYPIVNPTPIHRLELIGTLPVTLPIRDFEATYASNNSTSELVAGRCQRLIDVGRKSQWYTLPLRVKESVPITRDDDQHYHATLMADRFLPGRCGWHLQELHFRYESPGDTARANGIEGGDGQIQVRDEQQLTAEIAAGKSIYRGRMDLWCLRSPGIRQPNSPELCGDLETIGRNIPWSQRHSIPKEQAHSNSIVYATPDSQTIEFNFHDAQAVQPLRE